MGDNEIQFKADSRQKVFDLEHRRKMNFSLRQADDAFKSGRQQFSNLEAARQMAHDIKREAIEHLDKYLQQFETNFTRNGGKVIWAENASQATAAILKIFNDQQVSSVVKSKSIVTEEIHLNECLEQHDIDVLETDLGEFIQQLSNEPPYHIVAPSLHKSKEDIAKLFHEKLNTPPGLSPEQLTLEARRKLRSRFSKAGAGITGVNFILADIGGIAITENEGNAWMSSSSPNIHIAITGIEKILPSVQQLGLFWPLLATHGAGQQITVYNSIFTGPRQSGETDGPAEMYVILIDNGRTAILADPVARESLYCIRCGACLNVCPVYKNIGGHAYKATYSGPIGSVISPYLHDFGDYQHLSYASSLCGACTEVCPVGIKLHDLLLYNRRRTVVQKKVPGAEKWGWFFWKRLSLKRSFMNGMNGGLKNFFLQKLFSRYWGAKRKLPFFSAKSFNQTWKK